MKLLDLISYMQDGDNPIVYEVIRKQLSKEIYAAGRRDIEFETWNVTYWEICLKIESSV